MIGFAHSLTELFFLLMIYISGLILFVVMLAVAIAWGIRWGGTWLLKEISNDPQLVLWLKDMLNRSDNNVDGTKD